MTNYSNEKYYTLQIMRRPCFNNGLNARVGVCMCLGVLSIYNMETQTPKKTNTVLSHTNMAEGMCSPAMKY